MAQNNMNHVVMFWSMHLRPTEHAIIGDLCGKDASAGSLWSWASPAGGLCKL